jgi:hypothetical protein
VPALPELDVALAGGNVEISWLAVPCVSYQLQSQANISSTWVDIGGPVTGAGTVTVTNAASAGEAYYRLSQSR